MLACKVAVELAGRDLPPRAALCAYCRSPDGTNASPEVAVCMLEIGLYVAHVSKAVMLSSPILVVRHTLNVTGLCSGDSLPARCAQQPFQGVPGFPVRPGGQDGRGYRLQVPTEACLHLRNPNLLC